MAKAAISKQAPPPKLPDLVEYQIEQSSAEWYAARLGRATASNFSKIMAEGDKKSRSKLLRELAAEIMTEHVYETYESKEMTRGKEMEPIVRDWYARTKFSDVRQIGFIFNPAINAGWSPDGLIGDDGALEMKWHKPEVMVALLDKGTFPTEHRAQVHGGLLVGRRKWLDYVAYSHPKLPKYVARIEVDPVYQNEISEALEVFNWDLQQLVKKLRGMMP